MSQGGTRWNEPVRPLRWVRDIDHVLTWPDGRTQRIEMPVFRWSDIQRMRQGYVCANCFEPQEQAFPEKCSVAQCGFPMRERQSEFLARNYRENVRTGEDPPSAQEQMERAQMVWERDMQEAGLAVSPRQSSILVPRGISAT